MRHKGREGTSHADIWGKAFQAEGSARRRVLRWDHAHCVGGKAQRLAFQGREQKLEEPGWWGLGVGE